MNQLKFLTLLAGKWSIQSLMVCEKFVKTSHGSHTYKSFFFYSDQPVAMANESNPRWLKVANESKKTFKSNDNELFEGSVQVASESHNIKNMDEDVGTKVMEYYTEHFEAQSSWRKFSSHGPWNQDLVSWFS